MLEKINRAAFPGPEAVGKVSASVTPCIQPSPKVLVSCRSAKGENNALAVAYCCNCSYDPPMVMVGIVPSRYSYHMVKETGCFVVNLVSNDFKETFDYLGSKSGRDGDKLAEMRVRLAEGKMVHAPILADCPVSIECEVVSSIMTGSHEMFVGKIVYVHANPALIGEKGDIDFSRIDFL